MIDFIIAPFLLGAFHGALVTIIYFLAKGMMK